ncbi:partial Aerobic respiration control protein ArcA [Rhizobiaceae bacterium]|nr:partial Aerobic respiration control protein ArcA [Rhizobiaceae bacterium]
MQAADAEKPGMADIIVVDDEADVAFMIADFLNGKGHAVRMAADGSALRREMDTAAADLVVLDLNLPGEDGLSLARWLREHFDAGIMMLTGVDTPFDRVAGLEVGADDYLAKPFAPEELEARSVAILRRRRPNGKPLPAGHRRFGPYVLDEATGRLTGEGDRVIQLSAMELELVLVFARNPGRVFAREELLDLAPPRLDDPFDRSIDSRITRLRRRIERDPAKPELIKTVRGAGYLYPRS